MEGGFVHVIKRQKRVKIRMSPACLETLEKMAFLYGCPRGALIEDLLAVRLKELESEGEKIDLDDRPQRQVFMTW